MRRTLTVSLVVLTLVVGWGLAKPDIAAANTAANFENLSLAPGGYWNGSDGSGGFTSGPATFNNLYTIDAFSGWAFWGGWSYSNVMDAATAGYTNQYAAAPGGAKDGSNYGVAYLDTYYGTTPTITLAAPSVVQGAWFTNTTYAYWDMMNGTPGYSKKFGGATGTDPDWFLLTVTGLDASGQVTGTVPFYLADFRSGNPAQDYILNDWTWADLESLGAVKTLEFTLTSSDNSDWGMNTPAYFAMDDLVAAPEPATLALLGLGAAGIFLRRKRNQASAECGVWNAE